MQLHRLRLRAIGPFVGEHEIDFAALAAGGIFLLEGPTGAGKSTLIDAIVYALYGTVAGETSKDRIRSGFAAPDTESFVDLVFETSSGLYRVRRSPEWWRPKKRGEGVTKQQATGSLWRLTSPDDLDGGEHVSARLDEIGAEIEQAVGLDRGQFVQTIVLPQGEFATFLRAKPEERRHVLQRVFGTQDYERIQDELLRARKAALDRLGAAQRDVEGAVQALCAVLRPFEDPAVEEDLRAAARDGDGLADLVADQLAIVGTAKAAAHGRVAAARTALTSEQEAAAGARDRRDAARRVVELHDRRATLLEGADEHESRVERLGAARRAAAVAGPLGGLARARAAEEVALRALDSLEDGSALRGLDRAGLVAARDAAQRDSGALDGAVRLAADSAQRATERDEKRRALAGATESLASLDDEIAGRPRVLTALQERLAEVRPLAETVGKAQGELEHAAERLRAARAVTAVRVELVEVEADVARLAAAATKRVDEETRLRTLRIAGIAGELATSLTEGEPCLVCGSQEHPAPAELTPDHADEDQVLAAEADRRAAEQELEKARALLGQIESRLARHEAEAGGLTEEAAEQVCREAGEALDAAREAVTTRDHLEQELAAAAARDKELAEQRSQLESEIAALRSEIGALERHIEQDTTALDAARGDFATVEERRAHLAARCEEAEALLAARDRRTEAGAHVADRRAELETALAEHGFDDAGTARAALLEPAALDALEAQVAAHHDEANRITEALADPELVAAFDHDVFAEMLGVPDPGPVDLNAVDAAAIDVAALDESTAAAAAALTAAEAVLREAEAAAVVAEKRASDGARGQAELLELLESTAAAREAAAPVVRMADLATGAGPDNPRRLTLATYVLLRRFEEVVAVANERLAAMSDGRYALERTDERETGGGYRQGLALRVRDHMIDDARDPRTLSGGETFYVSLCLALALAQVVTAEAGGVDLGTLFVDEGFGTLDPHVLEAVVSQLGALHAEGRVVGIISHVTELKDTIAERIAVRPTSDGPSTITVIA